MRIAWHGQFRPEGILNLLLVVGKIRPHLDFDFSPLSYWQTFKDIVLNLPSTRPVGPIPATELESKSALNSLDYCWTVVRMKWL
jgi:hypothetical protein